MSFRVRIRRTPSFGPLVIAYWAVIFAGSIGLAVTAQAPPHKPKVEYPIGVTTSDGQEWNSDHIRAVAVVTDRPYERIKIVLEQAQVDRLRAAESTRYTVQQLHPEIAEICWWLDPGLSSGPGRWQHCLIALVVPESEH